MIERHAYIGLYLTGLISGAVMIGSFAIGWNPVFRASVLYFLASMGAVYLWRAIRGLKLNIPPNRLISVLGALVFVGAFLVRSGS